jgi:hypothetical protein
VSWVSEIVVTQRLWTHNASWAQRWDAPGCRGITASVIARRLKTLRHRLEALVALEGLFTVTHLS